VTGNADTALCIYCGTERPRAEATCPTCGREWIDRRIVAEPKTATAGSVAPTVDATADLSDESEAAAPAIDPPQEPDTPSPADRVDLAADLETTRSDLTDEDATAPAWSDPAVGSGLLARAAGPPSPFVDSTASGAPGAVPEVPAPPATPAADPMEDFLTGEVVPATGRRIHPVLIGFGVALLLFGFGDLAWSRFGGSNVAAAPTTTVATTAATTTQATTTTAPTTTIPATTTTPTTTTTTIPFLEPSGDPVDIAQLTLGARALGPLEIGDPAAEVLGRLAGGLGQPDSISGVSGDYGLCPDVAGSVTRWGALEIVTSAGASGSTFVGYRMNLAVAPDSATATIPTISGVRLGDTVGRLQTVYSGLSVFFPGDATFVLASSGGDVLLWGPVSGTSTGETIQGIYSPNACDGGAG
jgi:hypothetical protein